MVLEKLQEVSMWKIFWLTIWFVVFVFLIASKFTWSDIQCWRHEWSDICFCDCDLNFDLQLSWKKIQQVDLSFQNTVWTTKYLFDAKKTFDKSMMTEQCSQYWLYWTLFEYASYPIE